MAELRQIVRIGNIDVDGKKPLGHQLTKVKGVGTSMANMICSILGLDRKRQAGSLSNEEVKRIEDALQHPLKFGSPTWMLNRRNDPESGEDAHLISADLRFTQDQDIKMMRKMKSYKGVRHGLRLPVRGQQTKSNFRKNKGKVASVKRKKK